MDTSDKEIRQSLQNEISSLNEALKGHTLRWMLGFWLIPPFLIEFSIFLIAVYLSFTGGQTALTISLARLETLGSDIFVATITVIGLIIGFLPIIGFFYLGEIKDRRKEIENSLVNEKEGKSDEIKQMLDGIDYLYDVIASNLQSAIKKYMSINLVSSAIAIVVIILSYVSLGTQDTVSSLESFMTINIFALIPILNGIFPLVSLTFYAPSYKVVRQRKNGRTLTQIIPPKD